MNKHEMLKGHKIGRQLVTGFLLTLAILCLGMATPYALAMPFEKASINIEVNATDGDAGIQISFTGEEWKKVKVFGPDKRKVFEVMSFAGLRGIGGNEVSTESEEPPFTELPLVEFLQLFPAGEYRFDGKAKGGGKLTGTAILSHVIPAAPEIVEPAADAVLNALNPLVITWNPVAQTWFGSPDITISGYQVVVERVVPAPLVSFSVDLPPDATSVTVPAEFIEPGAQYKVEVLARETSGNQTVTERLFATEPAAP